MSIHVEGTIERKNIGAGTWALVTNSKTYELYKPASDLQKAGLHVKVEGQVRDDVMSFAMIGPILEVQKFEVVGH